MPVRIPVKELVWSKTFRRIANRNADLTVRDMAAHATMEQYRLFTRYQRSRHSGGEMSTMGFRDFRAMVEDSPIDTRIIEFRDDSEELIAVMLADRQADAAKGLVPLQFEM